MDGAGVVSAPAEERAAELMELLLDPQVRAVVPPWGGELAVEVLPHLDVAALIGTEPTWVVGFSDTSTLLLPLTTAVGWATVHGQNLLDTPYRVPAPLLHWLDVATADPDAELVQGPSTRHRAHGFDPWEDDPTFTEHTFDTATRWRLIDDRAGGVEVTGRLVGGCIETVSALAGSAYGDLVRFREECAPEGILLYLEASDERAVSIARHLWRMRLSGWFDVADAVLVGRTSAPDDDGFTQEDAVRSALRGLDVPVVMDVDCGHLPPQMCLVNGATARLAVGDTVSLTQWLGR
jgi:muramoyltetrapeptide carboxypeptidase LdcA involved in peptidoglycan recycling